MNHRPDGTVVSAGTLAIREYQATDNAAIGRLNDRFRAAGSTYVQYAIDLDPRLASPGHRERLFVVTDGDEIRGGAYLREAPVAIGDAMTQLGFVRYPLAESLIDRSFSGVPAALLLQLLREQPQLAAVGLGGHAGQFAQLLARLKWTGDTVPSYFCPMRPHAIATALPHMQRSPRLRRLAALVRWSGAGHLGSAVLPSLLRMAARRRTLGTTLELVPEFSADIDELWVRARRVYPAIGTRDTNAAHWRFPLDSQGVTRFEVRRHGALIGWFVLQVLDLRRLGNASPYGPLTLGILHDCLALPENAAVISAWALDALANQRVDLALAVHSHVAWQAPLRRIGFLLAPANFAFYRAPATNRVFDSLGVEPTQLYVTRGDDGLLVL